MERYYIVVVVVGVLLLPTTIHSQAVDFSKYSSETEARDVRDVATLAHNTMHT